MDAIQQYIKSQIAESFNEQDQITLGEIIEKIESFGLVYGNENEPKKVQYDFGSAVPTTLDSWRGSYDELALGYELSGYDNPEKHFSDCTAEKLLNELKSAIGKEFTGWKGGEFTMDENTPVWVANSGNSGDTGIVDVIDDGWRIIIITQLCKY